MKIDIDTNLLDNIIINSKDSDLELRDNIHQLIELYTTQQKENAKLRKENNFFMKKFDKRQSENKENTNKDRIIEQQSRMAAMGEMIDSVAHQWKQPLNAISMMIELLKADYADGDVNEYYIDELDSTIRLQIEHMVTTLGEFRNFLRPSTKNDTFYMSSVLDNTQILMKDELISQNIHIEQHINENIKIFGNKNEFKHLFINLINNSIDAFNERKIKVRKIKIDIYRKENKTYIDVEDNAGGIPEKIIDNIFEANITSKPIGKGTGIGLYMSSKIVAKNHGKISVKNTNEGAKFTIVLQDPII